MHGNDLASLGHNLLVRMHPFQAPQCPADGLVLGRFGKNTQDRNDTLWCVPLSMELMTGAGTFHLPCGCVWEWSDKLGHELHVSMHPFQVHSAHWLGWLWSDLAKRTRQKQDIVVCASVRGADDWSWHVPLTLWVCVNGLTSLGHELHVRMHPFQAPQYPADGLVLGRFGKKVLGRNDT